MELKDYDIWAVVAYVLPGLLMVEVRSLSAKSRLAPISKESIFSFLIVTVLYLFVLLAFGIPLQSRSSISALQLSTLLQYFVFAPAVLGLVYGLLERYGVVQRVLARIEINVPLPFSRVWLEIFSDIPEGTFLIVVLKDGTMYNTMVTRETRFSSDPAEPDLYLGQTYSLSEWEPSKPQRGVFIPGSEIRSIEVIRTP
jgi:Family of unknown function (DUF6338)